MRANTQTQKLTIHLTLQRHCPPLNSRHDTPLAHAVPLNISMTTFLRRWLAEEQTLPSERPYRTAGGTTVDLAIQDEHRMAHVCHYVMTHVANSIYYADALKSKPTQKQYSLKAGLRRFHDRGNAAVVKELTQFHTLKCFRP